MQVAEGGDGRWLVRKKSSHCRVPSHPVPGTPGHFFRGTCEAKSGEGAVLPVCVCGNVQGNCGGRLLIKFGKYLFRSCNRAARQAGKKGAMDGGGGPRMKMREAGFVPTVGVLQAFQSGD